MQNRYRRVDHFRFLDITMLSTRGSCTRCWEKTEKNWKMDPDTVTPSSLAVRLIIEHIGGGDLLKLKQGEKYRDLLARDTGGAQPDGGWQERDS